MLPVGLCDSVSHNGNNPMKLFCPKCQELYEHNVPNGNYIDGAFFGTTFPHLYLQTYSELLPTPRTTTYVPRVFGFKVHKVNIPRPRSPLSPTERPVCHCSLPLLTAPHPTSACLIRSVVQGSEQQQQAPLALEEWPKRPKNEPMSDWDS